MKFLKILYVSLFALTIIAGCNEENMIEYSNEPTVVEINNPEIYAIPGQEILITAQLTDDFGIKYVSLFSGGLSLDDEIGISSEDEIIDQTEFSYSHELPMEITGSKYEITMKVKNLTGQVTEKLITVILDE